MMNNLRKRRKLLTILVVLVISFVLVPVAMAWPFGDVPVGYWAYSQIQRFSNLHITSGCGGGNFCPEDHVTRAQMAVFMTNLTTANTTANEPYLFNLNHQGPGAPPAIRATSKGGNGIAGFSNGAGIADNGVYGETNSSYWGEAGVRGASTSSATGVIGVSSGGWGGYLQGATENTPDLVLGGTSNTNDNGMLFSSPSLPHSDIIMVSYDEAWIHLDENNDEAGNFAIFAGNNERELLIDENGNWYGAWGNLNSDNHLRVRDDFYIHVDDTNDDTNPGYFIIYGNGSNQFLVDENGNTYVYGNHTITGTKSAAVETSEGTRKVYTMESPEVWIEDFGTGQLVDGQAVVSIDPLFLETVNTEVDYHVFLTPLGDCNGLYVINKTATSFEVHELGGGTTDISFDYRIVAKRLGYEGLRLETPDLNTEELMEPFPPTTEMDEAPIMNQPFIVEMNESEEE